MKTKASVKKYQSLLMIKLRKIVLKKLDIFNKKISFKKVLIPKFMNTLKSN